MKQSKRLGRAAAALMATAILLGGCQITKDDLEDSGGLFGHYSDKVLPARTQEMQVYRATLILALLYKTGADTLKEPDDIAQFGASAKSVQSDLDRLENHVASPSCSKISTDGADCGQLFDDDLPRLETHMVRLAALAMPRQEFEKVVGEFTSGSYLAGGIDAAKLAGKLLYTGHDDAARLRTVVQLMQLMASPDASPVAPYSFTKAAQQLPSTPPDWAYRAMYNLIRSSCHDMKARLPDPSKLTCDLSRGVHVAAPDYYKVDATKTDAKAGA